MDFQEKYFDKLDRDIESLKTSFEKSEGRIEAIVREGLAQTRHLDTQRHTDMREIHSDMREIRASLGSQTRWMMGLIFTSIAAIATLLVTVVVTLRNTPSS